jgi:ribonuclease BN (tRNA processing enzyme)
VFISHGHPDHRADLSPPLRAPALREDPPAASPAYALPGTLDAVLALDRPGMLAGALALHEFSAGTTLDIGPFRAATRLLPHSVPNAGLRLAGGGRVLVYTGDSVAAMLAFGLARPELMIDADQVDRALRACVGAGALDGVTARPTLSDDGVPLETQRSFVTMLRSVVTIGLSESESPGH